MEWLSWKDWRKWVNLPFRLLKKHLTEMKREATERREKRLELLDFIREKEQEREKMVLRHEEEEEALNARWAEKLREQRERQTQKLDFVDGKIAEAQGKVENIRGFKPGREDKWKKLLKIANMCRPLRKRTIYEVLRRAFLDLYEGNEAD